MAQLGDKIEDKTRQAGEAISDTAQKAANSVKTEYRSQFVESKEIEASYKYIADFGTPSLKNDAGMEEYVGFNLVQGQELRISPTFVSLSKNKDNQDVYKVPLKVNIAFKKESGGASGKVLYNGDLLLIVDGGIVRAAQVDLPPSAIAYVPGASKVLAETQSFKAEDNKVISNLKGRIINHVMDDANVQRARFIKQDLEEILVNRAKK